jgi:hypothetical protein
VTYPSIGNFTWSNKKYTFGGQKGENKPSEPKNGIWGPKSVWSCDISIDREFNAEQEKYNFRGQMAIIGAQRPKTEFGAQNQYCRVIYPSIGNSTWSKKKCNCRGQKGYNRPPTPKNGICGP